MYGMPTTGISGWFYLIVGGAVGLIVGGAKLLRSLFKVSAKTEPSRGEGFSRQWKIWEISQDDS